MFKVRYYLSRYEKSTCSDDCVSVQRASGGGVFRWQPPLHQLLNWLRGSSYLLILCRRTRDKSKSESSANAEAEAEVIWTCDLRQCKVSQDSRLGDSERLELRAELPDNVHVYICSNDQQFSPRPLPHLYSLSCQVKNHLRALLSFSTF